MELFIMKSVHFYKKDTYGNNLDSLINIDKLVQYNMVFINLGNNYDKLSSRR